MFMGQKPMESIKRIISLVPWYVPAKIETCLLMIFQFLNCSIRVPIDGPIVRKTQKMKLLTLYKNNGFQGECMIKNECQDLYQIKTQTTVHFRITTSFYVKKKVVQFKNPKENFRGGQTFPTALGG